VLFVVLSVSTYAVVRLDIRRHGVEVSLSEVPFVLALCYLSPTLMLATRVLSALIVQIVRKADPVKGTFNVVMAWAGTACASYIVMGFELRDLPDPRSWSLLAGAVLANSLLTTLSVGGVITLVQGPSHMRRLWRSLGFSVVVTGMNIIVGLTVLLTLQASRWSVLLLACLAVTLGFGYRSYVRFMTQHKNVTEMYNLARVLSSTGSDGTLADVLLVRVRAAVEAESATLWLPAQGRHPEVLLSARVDYDGLLDSATTPDSLRQQSVASGETVLAGPRAPSVELRDALKGTGVKDAIVVPLRSGTVAIGTLEVAGRLGDRPLFGPDDLRFVETIAAHAGVALENARLVDRLRFDAMHDPMTCLPNRRRMLAALGEAIAAPPLGETIAVVLFDVVGLRQVNESLGYAAGDRILTEVAKRLRDLAPAGAMIARVGGDEFVVELRAVNAESALTMAESIRDGLREPIAIDSLAVDVDATVGVAVHPEHGDSPDVLLQRAEVAAYMAKQQGVIQLFNAGLESRSARRLGLAGDLRRALDCDELEVYFQPKLAIPDRRLLGVECLARWEHGVHGFVAPLDVVAVAEHTGQLGRLTEFVLREGLRRARGWRDSGQSLSIAINVAARTLLDPSFPDQVASLLEEFGVSPHLVTLEITEAAMVADSERPLPTIHRLHEVGVRLSVDDFGTGFSSLAYLRRLPIQEIKVDRTFVQGMATDPRDLAIVRTVADMARHLDLTSVAEGVESEVTLGMLRDIGCDVGQGFLFSRPLPYERLDTWLRGQARTATVRHEPEPMDEVRRLRAVP
jgi:diguanylate cyclase (GGDEF)-like protein